MFRLVQFGAVIEDKRLAVDRLEAGSAVAWLDSIESKQATCVLHRVFGRLEIGAQVAATLFADVLRVNLRAKHINVVQNVAKEPLSLRNWLSSSRSMR